MKGADRLAGFTLLEMLIVVAIVVLVAALGIGAYMIIPERAQVRGTEALVAKLDSRLAQRLNEFNQRRSSIRTLDGGTFSTADSWLANNEPSRAHVIAVIRTLRQEFPERFVVDVTPCPANPPIVYGQWDVIQDQAQFLQVPAMLLPLAAYQHPISAIDPQNELPPSALAYKARIEQLRLTNPSPLCNHTPETARAECLYMILTASGMGGATGESEEFGAAEVADTDGDGLPEFVDKWGRPIQFFLWPSYYTSPKQNPGAETDPDDPSQLLLEARTASDWWSNNSTSPTYRDTFEGLFHSVTHFLPASPPLGGRQPKGFRTHPLIISAGPDGGFGLRCAPGLVGNDGIMGTLDDSNSAPGVIFPGIGLMFSVGPDGLVGTGDDAAPLISATARITDPSIQGYGMDDDNIDNHHLRAR